LFDKFDRLVYPMRPDALARTSLARRAHTGANHFKRVGADMCRQLWYLPPRCAEPCRNLWRQSMTQKHVQISAYAILMILGVSTAWAETKKERSRELLPAPRCCCDESDSVIFGCCAAKDASSCCAKQTQTLTANCSKSCDIEHWLHTACPLDIRLKIVVEPAVNEAGMLVLGMKGIS